MLRKGENKLKKKSVGILQYLIMPVVAFGLLAGVKTTALADEEPVISVKGELLEDGVDTDASGVGWTYNGSTKTITLNGFSYTGNDRGIYVNGIDELNVVLTGNNTITVNEEGYPAIEACNGALSFSGTGSLKATAVADVILSSGNLTIQGCSIDSECIATDDENGSTGICSYEGCVSIKNATIKATGGTGTWWSVGINSGSSVAPLTIENSNITAVGKNAQSQSYGLYAEQKVIISDTVKTITAIGNVAAVRAVGGVYNGTSGMGWTDVNGTSGETVIAVSSEGQQLDGVPTFKKVVFSGAAAIAYSVMVNNGTGGGAYTEGDAVTITANAPAAGKKFDKWEGTDGLTFTSGNSESMTATFTMPARAVTVTARYKDLESVAAPTFSPAGGTYTTAQNVTISCATGGATIYYTTDGSVPSTSSTKYTGAIPVSSTTTIKAFAVKDGMNASAVSQAIYTIKVEESGNGQESGGGQGKNPSSDNQNQQQNPDKQEKDESKDTKKTSKEKVNKKQKKTSLSKVKVTGKKITFTFKPVDGIDGYQIQYSKSKKFKTFKNINIKGKNTKTYKIKKPKSKGIYYVRIRTVKKVKGVNNYSKWSKTKNVKVK